MAALPFKERDLVAKTMVEFANLKQRFTAGRDRCNADEQDLINVALKLLSTLASGVVGQSQTTVRSVRNPHRKVPHDIPELQREILGLEGFDLAGKGRRLFSQGPVVARKKTREEDGHLFLFSDILLYVSRCACVCVVRACSCAHRCRSASTMRRRKSRCSRLAAPIGCTR